MNKKINIIKSAENYIKKHDDTKSVEELFIEFNQIVALHKEFEKYLKEQGLNQKLETMQRNKRLMAKRQLFASWYSVKNQDTQFMKETLINLSEMTFVTPRSVIRDLTNDTTV